MEEFESALKEFTEMFGHVPEFYAEHNLPVPTFEDSLNNMRKSMLESSGPGLETIEQKAKAMRDEVEGWKKVKQMPIPEREKVLGYKWLGN